MRVMETVFDKCLIIEPDLRIDERATMTLLYRDDPEKKRLLGDFTVTEQRFYMMEKHAFFGIHLGPSKLLSILSGYGLDYLIDLRKDSPTYKQYRMIELSADMPRLVYVPSGFGHAFLALKENTMQAFAMDTKAPYEPASPVHYRSPGIELDLPIKDPILSDYDRNAKMLE